MAGIKIIPTVNSVSPSAEQIAADTVDGFHASQTAGANEIPVKDSSGDLTLPTGNVVLTAGNIVTATGNVLIGTPIDNGKTLQVKGPCSIGDTTDYEALLVRRDVDTADAGVWVQLQTKNSAGAYFTSGLFSAVARDVTPGAENGDIYLQTIRDGSFVPGIGLIGGDVLIGATTSTGTGKLQVTGTGYFSYGVDVRGASAFGGVAISGSTYLNLTACDAGASSLRVAHGTAPTTPVNGDIWTTTAGLFIQIDGVTKQVAFV